MTIEDAEHGAEINHDMATHVLSQIRNERSPPRRVRQKFTELGRICGYELANERLDTEEVTIETPQCETEFSRVTDSRNVVLIGLIRASLPFIDGLLDVFPHARVGMVRLTRHSETIQDDGTVPMSVTYQRIPEITEDDTVIIADPMLGTGSSVSTTLEESLSDISPKRLILLTAVTVPSGMKRVSEAHPELEFISVSIDDGLSEENGHIVPGLGDAGDRAFGTHSRMAEVDRIMDEEDRSYDFLP